LRAKAGEANPATMRQAMRNFAFMCDLDSLPPVNAKYGDVVREAEAVDTLARLPKSDRGT
jgi:hypothetical protein